MGTVGYMSPEQVCGLPGRPPLGHLFLRRDAVRAALRERGRSRENTPGETVAAIIRDDPPELTGSGRNISPALDHVVRHCLEKEPGNRFQSAKDVAFALSEASGPGRRRPACMRFRRPSGKEVDAGRGGVGHRGRGGRSLSVAAPADCIRRGRRGQARGRAAVREPGLARGRLLRRRDRGCRARQAHLRAGPRGDRARQLDALQEDDQDAAGDRPTSWTRTIS